MKQTILFIQGSGIEGYNADKHLADSLQQSLGDNFDVHFPRMNIDESVPDFGWPEQIGKEMAVFKKEIILAGHSLGASMLLKYLTENNVGKKIKGIFLLSTPFWSGEEDWVKGIKLREHFAHKLPPNAPLYLYHAKDDKVVPFSHLEKYASLLPQAVIRKINSGGHQFNNDLKFVAEDIKKLYENQEFDNS